MLKYKLTTRDLTTHNGFQWHVGVPVETHGGGGLCGPGWLHYYHDPLLAVFLNPIHGDYDNPRLWEVEAEGKHLDDLGLKGGCTRMTLIREIELPVMTTTQRVAFGILCALETCREEQFVRWANAWLDGSDRSEQSAWEIRVGLGRDSSRDWAATAAAWSAAMEADWAVEATAAAAAAATAAWAVEATTNDWAATAAWAVKRAERAAKGAIDLVAIAQKAMNY